MPMRVHPEAAPSKPRQRTSSGSPSRAAALFFVVLLAAFATVARSTDASACALMPIGNAPPPSLASERVLILYDEERQLEHFVREVRFDDAAGTFAFVVPTPERP